MSPEKHYGRRRLRRPARLRPQHPKDPDSPPGWASFDYSRVMGSRNPAATTLYYRRIGVNALLRANSVRCTEIGRR